MALFNSSGFTMTAKSDSRTLATRPGLRSVLFSVIALGSLPAGDALALKPGLTSWLSDSFSNYKDKREARAIVAADGERLKEYPQYEDDRSIVMAAVENDGLALQFASESLRNDSQVVLAALQNNGCALKFASEHLKDDEIVVEAAVKNAGLALQYVSESRKKHRYLVLAAMKQNAMAIQYAPESLKDDTAFQAAVNTVKETQKDSLPAVDGWSLKKISKAQKVQIINQFKEEVLLGKKTIVPRTAVGSDRKVYDTPAFIQDFWGHCTNEKVVMAAVKKNGLALQYASDNLRGNRDVVMEAVKEEGLALEFASDDLKKDNGILRAAVEQNSHALAYALFSTNLDAKVVKEAVRKNMSTLYFVPKGYTKQGKENYKRLVDWAVEEHGKKVLRYASDEMKRDWKYYDVNEDVLASQYTPRDDGGEAAGIRFTEVKRDDGFHERFWNAPVNGQSDQEERVNDPVGDAIKKDLLEAERLKARLDKTQLAIPDSKNEIVHDCVYNPHGSNLCPVPIASMAPGPQRVQK